MAELINREAFLKRFTEKYRSKFTFGEAKTLNVMFEELKKEPTAYDVEKVAQSIHEYFVERIYDCEEENIPHEILEYNKAICDIVRKGGVE